MSSSGFWILLLCVFHLVLLLPFSSENTSSQINGTRGAPWFWRCHQTFSEPLQPEDYFIYWQGQNNSVLVVYMYHKGKPDFEYQSLSFKNRAKIFPDQLRYGNLSLVIEELTLKDDKISLEVVLKSRSEPTTKKLCQTTVYVAAPFQEPKLEMNQTDKTATCSTKGGYPKPEIKWTSQDVGTQSERTLEQREVRTNMTSEDDGTYSISSTANITGSQKVTCGVHNPTSNQTLSVTKNTTLETSPPGKKDKYSSRSYLGTGIAVASFCIFVLTIIVCCIKSNWRPQCAVKQEDSAADEVPADRNAPHHYLPTNQEERISEDIISVDNQAVFFRNSVRRDASSDTASNEDTTAAAVTADTEEKTNFLSESEEDLGEKKIHGK